MVLSTQALASFTSKQASSHPYVHSANSTSTQLFGSNPFNYVAAMLKIMRITSSDIQRPPPSPVESIGPLQARIGADETTIAGYEQVRAAEIQENASPTEQISTLETQIATYKTHTANYQKLAAAQEATASEKLDSLQEEKDDLVRDLTTKEVGIVEVFLRTVIPAVLGIVAVVLTHGSGPASHEAMVQERCAEKGSNNDALTFFVSVALIWWFINRCLPSRR